MLAQGDVEKIDLISNKNIVRVYIKKDSLHKSFYRKYNSKNSWPGGVSKDGPQFEFRVTDVKEYEKTLQDYFAKITLQSRKFRSRRSRKANGSDRC